MRSPSLYFAFFVQFHLGLSSVEVVDDVRAPRDKVANGTTELKGRIKSAVRFREVLPISSAKEPIEAASLTTM